jgi:hypothetical protein
MIIFFILKGLDFKIMGIGFKKPCQIRRLAASFSR